MKVKTWDMLVFIYINMRTLRHIRGQEDFEDILLNIEDDLVRVDLDNK
jgi:hypothetical protein